MDIVYAANKIRSQRAMFEYRIKRCQVAQRRYLAY